MWNRHGEEMYERYTTRVCSPTHFLEFQTGRGTAAINIYVACKRALLHIGSPAAPNSCSHFEESFVYLCLSIFFHTVFILQQTVVDPSWRGMSFQSRLFDSQRVIYVLVAFLYLCVELSSRGSKAVMNPPPLFCVCAHARWCVRRRRLPRFPVTLLRHRGYTRLWAHCSASLSWTKTSVCFREGLASPPNICSCCWTPTALRHGQMLPFFVCGVSAPAAVKLSVVGKLVL